MAFVTAPRLLLVTAGFFIAWLHRVHENARGLGAQGSAVPAVITAWWPFRIASGILDRVGAAAGLDPPARSPSGPLEVPEASLYPTEVTIEAAAADLHNSWRSGSWT